MKYAAYDVLSIYAVGDSPELAIAKAREDSKEPDSKYETAPISDEFAAWIEENGWPCMSRTFGLDSSGTLIDTTDNVIDFRLQNEGSISILTPLTKQAEEWMDEHLPEEALRWGQGVVIEHRFVATIVNALANDGLSVE